MAAGGRLAAGRGWRRGGGRAMKFPARARITRRELYQVLLGWSFMLFSSARIVAYLPTLWAIHASADASQHSLWTWLIWSGSNLTMAAWLYEQRGPRPTRAIDVCFVNALMCAAVAALIAWYR